MRLRRAVRGDMAGETPASRLGHAWAPRSRGGGAAAGPAARGLPVVARGKARRSTRKAPHTVATPCAAESAVAARYVGVTVGRGALLQRGLSADCEDGEEGCEHSASMRGASQVEPRRRHVGRLALRSEGRATCSHCQTGELAER